MADSGPGGREVGRVSLRVLPDTSKFLPSLKKYAERVERTVAVRLGTTIDGRGLENDARRISERIERSVPTIRIPASPISDGFAADLARQVKTASAAIQANIPLTADGERLRRGVMVEVAALEEQIRKLDLEVPLDVEEAARAKAELRARVAALQAFATAHAVTIPVKLGAGSPVGGAGFLGISPAMLAGLSGVAAVLAGGVLASLPAIVASIAGPIGVIALGFQGIASAAKVAAPAFAAMRQAVSNEFAASLAPVFAKLAEVLPLITPQLEAIAGALGESFGAIVDQIASPEGIAALQGILQGVADAMILLGPSLGPLTQALLDVANTGMAAFVDMAPALSDALRTMADIFTYLSESGVISLAVQAFAGFVVAGAVVAGAVSAILIALAAGEAKMNEFRQKVGGAITGVLGNFGLLAPGVGLALSAVVALVRALPQRVTAAFSGIGELLKGKGAELIGGFIMGIYSMIEPLKIAARTVAGVIAAFFPGSPVKEGPLTSWNNGGAGKRLGEMLAGGLESSTNAVKSASSSLAGAVAAPSLVGAGVTASDADSSGSAWRDPYLLADILTDSLRGAPLVVDTKDNARKTSQHRNARTAL